MASITNPGSAAARWTLAALLRVLAPTNATAASMQKPEPKPKRRYPQQRDSFIEHSAMAREMYRL